MSSREQDLLYRHINSLSGEIDRIPQALVAREDALRIARFVARDVPVRARLEMHNKTGGPLQVENVIAEIRGTDKADEIVMLGAHLDSWEMGSGALDNGANCALVVETARAIRAANIRPRRTIRFALWNGEEQGMLGSWAYAHDHRGELDNLVAYVNLDGGTGAVTGWSLGGRTDTIDAVRQVLAPIASWGMNDHTFDISGGTDHLDFLFEGVPTLCANQVEANYIVNYHASSDTLDKVDLFALKRHTAYTAVTVLGIANRKERLGPRESRDQIEAQLKATGFDQQMKAFGEWDDWTAGRRGRQR
jgi:Zn-dependent M28 family amino/carboxypeptidase